MSPRRYAMERRAATVDSTRRRILDAALELYRTQGMARTTLGQVAERADVARATVVNHFGGSEGLATAAIESIATELDLPTLAIFQGATGAPDRVRRLVAAMFSLYERSDPWFTVLRDDIPKVPAAGRREKQFYSDVEKLYRTALGARSRSRRLVATVSALTSTDTFSALRTAGLSTRDAIEIVGDLLAGLVD